MGNAYPAELRQRVINDCNSGMKKIKVAEKWQVSYKWVLDLFKKYKETGSIEPKQYKRGRKRKLTAYGNAIKEIVTTMPDATLDEILPQVLALGADVCRATIHNELHRLKLTYKKK